VAGTLVLDTRPGDPRNLCRSIPLLDGTVPRHVQRVGRRSRWTFPSSPSTAGSEWTRGWTDGRPRLRATAGGRSIRRYRRARSNTCSHRRGSAKGDVRSRSRLRGVVSRRGSPVAKVFRGREAADFGPILSAGRRRNPSSRFLAARRGASCVLTRPPMNCQLPGRRSGASSSATTPRPRCGNAGISRPSPAPGPDASSRRTCHRLVGFPARLHGWTPGASVCFLWGSSSSRAHEPVHWPAAPFPSRFVNRARRPPRPVSPSRAPIGPLHLSCTSRFVARRGWSGCGLRRRPSRRQDGLPPSGFHRAALVIPRARSPSSELDSPQRRRALRGSVFRPLPWPTALLASGFRLPPIA